MNTLSGYYFLNDTTKESCLQTKHGDIQLIKSPIIKEDKKYRVVSLEELLKVTGDKNERYEVIRGNYYFKPFLDIEKDDCNFDGRVILNKIIRALEETLSGYGCICPEIKVLDASKGRKISFHVIVNNALVASHNHLKIFLNGLDENIGDEEISSFVDKKVTSSIRNFRTIFSPKEGVRPLIPIDEISAEDYEKYYIQTDFEVKPEDSRILEIKYSPIKVCVKNLTENEIDRLIGDVQNMQPELIPRAGGDLSQGIIFDRVDKEIPCPICKRLHGSDAMFVVLNLVSGRAQLRCFRDSENKYILVGKWMQDNHVTKRVDRLIGTDKFTPTIKYCEPIMRSLPLEALFLAMKAATSMGKTKLTFDYFGKRLEANPNLKILIVSHRRSSTSNTWEVFKPFDFKVYWDLDTKEKITESRVIIQLESLHRLNSLDFDIVFLDEVESLNTQFCHARQHGSGKTCEACISYNTLIKTAKTLIISDATLSDSLTNIFSRIRRKSPVKILNEYKRHFDKTVYNVKSRELNIHMAREAIRNDEKIVIICHTKEDVEFFRLSLPDEFFKLKEVGKLLYYHGDVDDEIKQTQFACVSKYWGSAEVVIYNAACEAGVSFELERFDKVFCFFKQGIGHAETAFQMMGRNRNTSEYYVNVFDTKANRNIVTPLSEQGIISQMMAGYLHSKQIVSGIIGQDATYNEIGEIVFTDDEGCMKTLEESLSSSGKCAIHEMLRTNLGKKYFWERLSAVLQEWGFVMIDYDVDQVTGIKEIEKEIKKLFRRWKTEIKEMNIKKMEEADLIESAEEMEKENNKSTKTEYEKLSIRKTIAAHGLNLPKDVLESDEFSLIVVNKSSDLLENHQWLIDRGMWEIQKYVAAGRSNLKDGTNSLYMKNVKIVLCNMAVRMCGFGGIYDTGSITNKALNGVLEDKERVRNMKAMIIKLCKYEPKKEKSSEVNLRSLLHWINSALKDMFGAKVEMVTKKKKTCDNEYKIIFPDKAIGDMVEKIKINSESKMEIDDIGLGIVEEIEVEKKIEWPIKPIPMTEEEEREMNELMEAMFLVMRPC